MKKLGALILCAVMLCTLFPVSLAEKTVTKVVFWHSMTDDAGVLLDGFVKNYNETIGAEKGVMVEAVFQGSYSDATTKINSMISSGQVKELPDVMQLDATGKVAYYQSGAAYTVDDLMNAHPEIDLSDMMEAAMGNWSYAGTRLGIPFATSTTVLYYNKTLLEAAGVDAPVTLADIAALGSVIPSVDANGEKMTIYATVPNTPTLANWLGQLGSDLVNEHNGTEGNATELACLENGALATFLTAWKELFASGSLQNNAGSSDAFVAGKQLLMTGSTSGLAGNLAKIGDRFELGVTFYPKVNEEASVGATLGGSCLVMFDKGEAKNQASWSFVDYMTGAQVQAEFAAGTGYIPANAGALETDVYQAVLAANPIYRVGVDQLAQTPASMRSVTVGPAADFYYGIQNCISEMLDEDLTVEETVDLMEDELGGLLTQYAKANQ